jgi:hypothetical protein
MHLSSVGAFVGFNDGGDVGATDGLLVLHVGFFEGAREDAVGSRVGQCVGTAVGHLVGFFVGF